MGREIGREHEGGDQGEVGLRGPVEEYPRRHGRARRVAWLHSSVARVRCKVRHDCFLAESFAYASGRYSIIARPTLFAEQNMIRFAAGRRAFVVALTLAIIACGSSKAQEGRRGFYAPPAAGTTHPVFAEHGMVVAQERLAAQIGADVLRQGG